MRKFLIILTLFLAVGAVGGAVMMWVDPSGNGWGGAPMLDLLRAKMPWPDIFFKDFIPSGFALLTVNGLTQFLAAPMMIALMEKTCRTSVKPYLDEGQETVGTYVNVSHDSAVPVGRKVWCESEVVKIDRRKIMV